MAKYFCKCNHGKYNNRKNIVAIETNPLNTCQKLYLFNPNLVENRLDISNFKLNSNLREKEIFPF